LLRTSFAAPLAHRWARTAAFSAAFALANVACANGTDAPSRRATAARISTRKDSGIRDLVRSEALRARNVGTSRVFDALGPALFAAGLERLRLNPPPELPGGGLAAPLASLGFRFPVTPEALARAYAVFANDGIYTEPRPGGATNARAVSAKTAHLMLDLLEDAVSGEHAPGRAAVIAGTRVAGKTGTFGTSEVFANFVGMFPVERPRYVLLVSVLVLDPRASGAAIAAPLFARVAGRLLARE
jgi:cell division protein FtsI (penicillin-binding protein 3)